MERRHSRLPRLALRRRRLRRNEQVILTLPAASAEDHVPVVEDEA